jgi:hypothetical protein
MYKKKRGLGLGVFWSIVFLILIVLVIVLFFLFGSAKTTIVDQENTYAGNVSLEIKDFNTMSNGVIFTLTANPNKKKIVGILFTFENFENKTEEYFAEVSYVCKSSEDFSVDLTKLFPQEVVKITMEPTIEILENPPTCVLDANVDSSYQTSKEKIKNFFSRFFKKF